MQTNQIYADPKMDQSESFEIPRAHISVHVTMSRAIKKVQL